MGLFRPYEQGNSNQDAGTDERRGRRRGGATRADLVTVQQAEPELEQVPAVAPAPSGNPRQPQKKGAPTPTRAQAEAARMERLHPTLSPKEQRRANREADRNARVQAMAATEQTPARQLVRDHVDARMTLTEWIIPMMLAVMVFTFAFPRNYAVQQVTSLVMVGLFVLWLANIFWVRRSLHRIAAERGIDVKQRGLFMYLTNRMMTMRALRRPAPRIKRGESY